MNPTLELLKIKTDLSLNGNQKQIMETHVIDLLENEFPEINAELEKASNASNIYRSVQCFADFTKQLVKKGNFKEVKHCFKVAERMLKDGNNSVKNAIENVYVFSISKVLEIANPLCEEAKKLLTESLKKEYSRQICARGI